MPYSTAHADAPQVGVWGARSRRLENFCPEEGGSAIQVPNCVALYWERLESLLEESGKARQGRVEPGG